MGNTRTKWRCGSATGALPAGALPTLRAPPRRVRVATVLDNEGAVADAVRARFGVTAEFAQVRQRCGGLECGYRDPARLGVDRWLATLAAWRALRQALVVVCAGTAATVDFVTGDGRHEGGYIAPGLRLLQDSLTRRAADIRIGRHGAPALVPGRPPPGVDTELAVAGGTMAMLVGYVEAAVGGARPPGGAVVFVTGGDAGALVDRLSFPARHVPTLVLDGLGVALP